VRGEGKHTHTPSFAAGVSLVGGGGALRAPGSALPAHASDPAVGVARISWPALLEAGDRYGARRLMHVARPSQQKKRHPWEGEACNSPPGGAGSVP